MYVMQDGYKPVINFDTSVVKKSITPINVLSHYPPSSLRLSYMGQWLSGMVKCLIVGQSIVLEIEITACETLRLQLKL